MLWKRLKLSLIVGLTSSHFPDHSLVLIVISVKEKEAHAPLLPFDLAPHLSQQLAWADYIERINAWLNALQVPVMAGLDSLQVPAVVGLDSLQNSSNGWAGLNSQQLRAVAGLDSFGILAMSGLVSMLVPRFGWAGLLSGF